MTWYPSLDAYDIFIFRNVQFNTHITLTQRAEILTLISKFKTWVHGLKHWNTHRNPHTEHKEKRTNLFLISWSNSLLNFTLLTVSVLGQYSFLLYWLWPVYHVQNCPQCLQVLDLTVRLYLVTGSSSPSARCLYQHIISLSSQRAFKMNLMSLCCGVLMTQLFVTVWFHCVSKCGLCSLI